MQSSDTGTEKRGRGRPRKPVDPNEEVIIRRGRGRPIGSKNKPKDEKKGKKRSYTVSEKALAHRRQVTNALPARSEEEMAYNARLIEHTMRINEIATHADRHDLATLKSCFIAYMQLCQEDGFNVGNLAAYASMGFNSIYDFNNFSKKEDPDIRRFCQFVKSTCAMVREGKVSDNKINPVIGIFWQRNYDNLRNDTEQVQNAMEQDFYDVPKSYKDKYRNLIGE